MNLNDGAGHWVGAVNLDGESDPMSATFQLMLNKFELTVN